MPRRLLWLLPFAALAGLIVVTRPGPAGTVAASTGIGSGDGPAVITATGTGQVEGQPDLLTLVLGVETRAASSQAALGDNANRANALITSLKSHGVAASDISTSQLSISTTTTPDGRITGYQVDNTVTARVHDLKSAGSIIDAAAASAGDAIRIQQIQFSISDDSSLLAGARGDAVRMAHDQAEQMAKAAGVHLGSVRSISESSSSPPPIGFSAAAGAPGAAAPTPIEPGTEDLTVSVTAVYEIEQ